MKSPEFVTRELKINESDNVDMPLFYDRKVCHKRLHLNRLLHDIQ